MKTEETAEQTARRLAFEADTARMARKIKRMMPDGVGYTLIMFNYGASGNVAYASTGNRGDMIKMLRHMLERLERSA